MSPRTAPVHTASAATDAAASSDVDAVVRDAMAAGRMANRYWRWRSVEYRSLALKTLECRKIAVGSFRKNVRVFILNESHVHNVCPQRGVPKFLYICWPSNPAPRMCGRCPQPAIFLALMTPHTQAAAHGSRGVVDGIRSILNDLKKMAARCLSCTPLLEMNGATHAGWQPVAPVKEGTRSTLFF